MTLSVKTHFYDFYIKSFYIMRTFSGRKTLISLILSYQMSKIENSEINQIKL